MKKYCLLLQNVWLYIKLFFFEIYIDQYLKRVCCQSISETLNESRKRTRTFSGLFVRISTLTCCIPYILHVHDRIVVWFSNISAYFAITQESSRKSCRRFRSNPFPPRRPGASMFGRDRVLAFVSSGVMISIKSIDVHIGHESSVGVCLAKRSRIYRIESARRHG